MKPCSEKFEWAHGYIEGSSSVICRHGYIEGSSIVICRCTRALEASWIYAQWQPKCLVSLKSLLHDILVIEYLRDRGSVYPWRRGRAHIELKYNAKEIVKRIIVAMLLRKLQFVCRGGITRQIDEMTTNILPAEFDDDHIVAWLRQFDACAKQMVRQTARNQDFRAFENLWLLTST